MRRGSAELQLTLVLCVIVVANSVSFSFIDVIVDVQGVKLRRAAATSDTVLRVGKCAEALRLVGPLSGRR